ncbi:DUF4399 domain-containing protein [Natronorarus salvus]|uniref:DUF4399 domain-containing protein n=1 Tax=Natronorarus salvus TaxID=3117733 RepID=UPI002F2674B6
MPHDSDGRSIRYSRRGVLLTGSAVSATALAGCLDDDQEETEPDDGTETDADGADDEDDGEVSDDDAEDEEADDDYDVADQPEDASVSFVEPGDGDTVETPVHFEFETEGFELASVDEDPAVGEGHLHVLGEDDCYPDGEVIPGPADDLEEDNEVWHLSDGSDTAEIEMDPGEYDVCVQIGDTLHRAFGETDEISITVVDEGEGEGDDA